MIGRHSVGAIFLDLHCKPVVLLSECLLSVVYACVRKVSKQAFSKETNNLVEVPCTQQ